MGTPSSPRFPHDTRDIVNRLMVLREGPSATYIETVQLVQLIIQGGVNVPILVGRDFDSVDTEVPRPSHTYTTTPPTHIVTNTHTQYTASLRLRVLRPQSS